MISTLKNTYNVVKISKMFLFINFNIIAVKNVLNLIKIDENYYINTKSTHFF